jgi:hypothetical protein
MFHKTEMSITNLRINTAFSNFICGKKQKSEYKNQIDQTNDHSEITKVFTLWG